MVAEVLHKLGLCYFLTRNDIMLGTVSLCEKVFVQVIARFSQPYLVIGFDNLVGVLNKETYRAAVHEIVLSTIVDTYNHVSTILVVDNVSDGITHFELGFNDDRQHKFRYS